MSSLAQAPRVTAVIPAYNRVQMVRRAVASALGQSYGDIEVLVIDDGSKLDIPAALSDIRDRRLRVVRHPSNRGAPAARNTGIALAAGEFVAFLDSDDEWLPNSIESQLASFAAAAPETVMVYVGARVIPPVKPLRDRFLRGDLGQALAVSNVIGSTSCVMVRRSALQAIGGFDEKLESCQDWDLYIRLAKLGPIEAVREWLVLYHVHDNSITGSAKASVAGHRRLRQKHAATIAALPPKMRAEHELSVAQLFLWKRAWRDAAACLLRAVRSDPAICPQVFERLVAPRIKRLARWGRALLPSRRKGY